MASGKVSKNSRTSKKQETMLPKRVKSKKQVILIEITNRVFNEMKQNEDISTYHGMPIIDTISYHGKKYLKVSRVIEE